VENCSGEPSHKEFREEGELLRGTISELFRERKDHGRVGYNEFDFFLENEEYIPFDGCKI
jgi:hypothetical protein